MVTFADGNANDVNSDEDNYWVFATGQTVGVDPASLVNYSFSPIDTYETDVALRDGRNDNTLYARNSGLFDGTDGIAIDGTIYEFSRNFTFSAEISFVGQTETVTTGVLVSRIVEQDNDASAPLHGTAIVRFNDASMQQIFDGPDGAGYSLKQIESVRLIANTGEQDRIVIQNRYDEAYPVICFARGTGIRTEGGITGVENLKVGDMVLTRDSGLQPIRWIGSRRFSGDELAENSQLLPIRIRAGALGVNTPSQDLVVSPQHRILIRSRIALRMFGSDEVLVAVKQLLEIDGIEIVEDIAEVEYFHFLFERHEIVLANGAETESLYTGPEALRAVGAAARQEIMTLFPELRDTEEAIAEASSARALIAGRMARQLAFRHARNQQALVF